MTNADVSEAVTKGKAKQLEQLDMTANEVLQIMANLARVDARSFYTEDGNPRPIDEWTAAQGAQVSRVETIIKNAKAGDGHTDTVLKLGWWDKMRALELLAKHFGVLTEQINLSMDDKVLATLEAGRQRVAAYKKQQG